MGEIWNLVHRLEDLRLGIAVAEGAVGWMGDYIDHGVPSEEVRQETMREIEEQRQIAAERRREMLQVQDAIRAAVPSAIETWVRLHQAVCRQLIADDEANDSDRELRHFIAGQTIEEWENVRSGEETYVHINDYYLAGYQDLVGARLEDLRKSEEAD